MGEIRVKVRLENLGDLCQVNVGKLPKNEVRSAEVEAIVDTGAVMSLLPRDLVDQLGLLPLGKMRVSLADDRRIELDRAGGLMFTVCGRNIEVECLVGPAGCEPLLGQLIMEGLDLIADPGRRTLTPRPESPDRPTIKMKRKLAYA